MPIVDRYMIKSLFVATVFITIVLASVILLTQSLRFLELVINSNASAGSFWILTMLALPRFLELIVPLALMAAVLFIYNRLTMDSELIVMRAVGFSPLRLARPALILAALATLFLFFVTFWLAPTAQANLLQLRQVIKAEYSTLMFRTGIFNQVGKGLTVYIRNRAEGAELRGLLIHDSRIEGQPPVTVVAKRGVIVNNEDGQQVVVYDGSRQDFDAKNGTVNRLNFDQYTIDLPAETGKVRQRWKEPDERTFAELLRPDPTNVDDVKYANRFTVEIQRRIIGPLLAPCFALVGLCFVLLGPVERRGQGRRITGAVCLVILLQTGYIAATNMAYSSAAGLALLYLVVLAPLLTGLFILCGLGARRRPRALKEGSE